MSYHWKLTTDAETEPITTAQAKAHLNIDHSDDDTYIGLKIAEARKKVESDTGRAFINQTWTLYADTFGEFENGIIYLPRSPLASVTTIKYYNSSNVQTTWSDAEYQADTGHEPGRVVTMSGYSYPTTYDRLSAVEIAYVVGYGADADNIGLCPGEMFSALYLQLGNLYENRESVVTGTIATPLPASYDELVGSIQVGWSFK